MASEKNCTNKIFILNFYSILFILISISIFTKAQKHDIKIFGQEDNSNQLWFATVEGLNYFNKEKNIFIRYNTKNGLPNNIIYGILEDNALKFTEKGFVEFGYTLNKDTKSPSIKFYVKDTGIGLSKENKESIFCRFTKLENDKKKLYRGAGLGLAICKNISSLLGGNIWIESE